MIEVDRHERVALITLHRPERRNAVDGEACDALAAAVVDAASAGARAIVLAGAGSNFCAGADLKAAEDAGFVPRLRAALDALSQVPAVTMAAVHGAALGAGTQLAISCDLRVVAPDARFGIPAAKLGLMVDQPTVQRIASLAGGGPARAILLASEELDADAALRLGLASRSGDLDAALAWAARIAELSPLSIAGHKIALNALEPRAADPAFAAAFRAAWESEDLAEGRAAFAQKRRPQFEGR